MTKEVIIGIVTVILNGIVAAIYLRQVISRAIKPHMFTWIIWGILGSTIFFAQYVADAGPGCWAMGTSALLSFTVAIMSFWYGEKKITRTDWIVFVCALSAIPVWLITSNPLYAVLLASTIDSAAYYPTFRKAWIKPHEEGVIAFFIFGFQMLLSLFALDSFTFTTAFSPIVIFILNTVLALMLLYRRRALA